ncbi:MAG: hypothetical protein NC421_08310 [Lachnospiraceae bacterium]|nr:hypothetical protein [Lachnospiraceae bacterium]
MKRITKLRLCDWSLLAITVAILASGAQLETRMAMTRIWVWIHIYLGIIFITCILWHISLHHRHGPKKERRTKHTHGRKNRFLGITFLLTFLSGIIATCHWAGTYSHSSIGGVHGKVGFLFIIAIILHIRNYSGFYLPAKMTRKKNP